MRPGSSPRASSSPRKPPLIAASTTSFTVPPSSRLIVFTSSSDARAQVKRRCLPIGPLSDDPVAGPNAGASLARPRTVPAARRRAPPGSAAAPVSASASRTGSATSSRAARAASSAEEGSVPTARSSAAGGDGSGETSKITRYRSVPDTPSTMQWCTLEISAQRSPARPSMTQYSHNG